ncbi:MAG: Asp-tRNA(Asn)/Glu-tRNA(Gln) amidotransferase subunit GatC [Bryobacterales bacterium]|nr:Asp-tRNA(Asn)/Glu-tRNA(Gln) amidotransferase subunit GatC [Bryobacterales bacterium]
MKLTEERVRYVANLANLALTDEEVSHFSDELSQILEYVDKLNELDTENVEPMTQVLFDVEDTATMRADVAGRTLSNEEALANAPLAGAGHFKVPLVIER